MEEVQLEANQPSFSSLTEIMDHFYNVPFEQFQKELNDWFSKSLLEKGNGTGKLQNLGITNLSSIQDLASKFYHQAELLKTISESKINLPDESK